MVHLVSLIFFPLPALYHFNFIQIAWPFQAIIIYFQNFLIVFL